MNKQFLEITNTLKAKDKNTLIVFILKGLGLVLFFIVTIFLTNFFPATEVGKYDYARSLLLIFGAFALLGFDQSIIFYFGFLKANNGLYKIGKVYFKMLLANFIISILIISLGYLLPNYVPWLREVETENIIIFQKVILILFFHSWMMLNIEVIRGFGDFKTSEFFRSIFRYLLFLIVAFFLLKWNLENYLVDGFLFSFVGLALFSFLFTMRKLKSLIIKNSNCTLNITLKKIISTSFPMALGSIMYFLLQTTDVLFVEHFMNYADVAYYAVAVKLSLLCYFIVTVVVLVLSPEIAEQYAKKNLIQVQSSIQKSARIIVAGTIPIVLILVIFGKPILSLFDEQYKNAYSAMCILVLGQTINAFFGIVGAFMNMTGKQTILQYIFLLAFIINLILNFLLIPKFGLNGAAWATCLSTLLWNLLAAYYVFRKDKIKVFLHF